MYDYCNDHWVDDERLRQIEMRKMEEMRKKLMNANNALVDKPYTYKINNTEIKKEVRRDRIIVKNKMIDELNWKRHSEYLKGLNERIAKTKGDN